MPATSLPELGPSENQLREAFRSYEQMKQELIKARAEVAEANRHADAMQTEVLMLREQLKDLQARFHGVQAYAVELTARLDVCVETITAAKNGARQYGAKQLVAAAERIDQGEEPDQAQVREIFARVERNGHGNVHSRLPNSFAT